MTALKQHLKDLEDLLNLRSSQINVKPYLLFPFYINNMQELSEEQLNINEKIEIQEMKDKIVFKKIETFISNKIEKILGEEMEKLKESLKIDLSQQISLKPDDKMISNLSNQLSNVKMEFLTIKEDINNLKNSNENGTIATLEKKIEDKESNMI